MINDVVLEELEWFAAAREAENRKKVLCARIMVDVDSRERELKLIPGGRRRRRQLRLSGARFARRSNRCVGCERRGAFHVRQTNERLFPAINNGLGQ